jgi:UDP-N-acetyl-D-glucosamine dehydrogenase
MGSTNGVGMSELALPARASARVDLTRAEVYDASIRDRTALIGVIGLGYAGLPLAVGFAEAGFDVGGVDTNARRVSAVNERESYLPDVSSDSLKQLPDLTAAEAYGRVHDMTALTICVPTPLSKTRTPDLSFVVAAAEKAAAHIRPGALVVLQSTTVPETTVQVLVPIFERATGGRVGVDFYLGYAPERVDPANRSGWTLRTTPKIVSGVTAECRRRTRLLYETVVDTVVEASSPTVAEMVKLYENTFRQVNIALANELALVCGRLGISAWEVIDAAATKPFGFMAHYPGPGLGGDCIPVVPHFISHRLKEYGYQTRMIEVAHEINTGMPEHVVGRVAEALNDRGRAVQGARILLLGVAYKPNVSDLRESPAMRIFVELAARGGDVRYCDPHVASVAVAGRIYRSEPWAEEAVADVDCVVILTHHDEFLSKPLWRNAGAVVVDTRNVAGAVDAGVVSI